MSILPYTREPNGQRRRKPPSERTSDIIGVVCAQPHRRGLVDLKIRGRKPDERHNPLAESPFGQLYLIGELTEAQYSAGLFWRRMVGRAKWAIACPSDRPSQLQLLKTYGLGREPTEEESLTARHEYDDATYHVRIQFAVYNGHKVLKILKAVCCQDRICDDLGLLKAGLNVLIRYQDLTRKRK